MPKRKQVIKEFDHMIKKMMEIYEKYTTTETDEVQADLKAMSKIIMEAHKAKERFITPFEKDEELHQYDE